MLGISIQSLAKYRLHVFEEMCLMKQHSFVPFSLKVLTFLLIFAVFFAVVLTGNFADFIPNSWIGVLETFVPSLSLMCKNQPKTAAPGHNLVIMNSGRDFKPRGLVLPDYRSVRPVDFVTPFVGDEVAVRTGKTVEDEGVVLRHDSKIPDKPGWNQESEAEVLAIVHHAVSLKKKGKTEKAHKLFEHALALAPRHPDVLTEFGLFHEAHSKNVVQAEEMFTRALIYSPWHKTALSNRERTLPLVEEIDNKMLQIIDQKREFFLEIPRHSAPLRRAMREAYFQHIYHTVALEGNTMTLVQTRSVLETHIAVGGKSVVEHNEILGMDEALRFLNRSLVHRIGSITLDDIKEIHRRVLGYVDPFQAGVFRDHQGITHKLYEQFVKHQVSEFSMEWNPNVELPYQVHVVARSAPNHMHFIVQQSDSTPSKTRTPG